MPFLHVWFSTKNRRWLLQDEIAVKAKDLFMAIAAEKHIELIETETAIDHVHMLLLAANDTDLSWRMKLLKGRSAYEIFRFFPWLKTSEGLGSFWQASYKARIVPENHLETVRRYIRTQDERLEKFER